MPRLKNVSRGGKRILFDEKWLETAMRKYIDLWHTIDESRSKKRRTGYYIYAKKTDFAQYPFLHYNFKRRDDAKFIIGLLKIKIPKLSEKKLYIKFCPSQRMPQTKYEVLKLNKKAREEIWKSFVV